MSSPEKLVVHQASPVNVLQQLENPYLAFGAPLGMACWQKGNGVTTIGAAATTTDNMEAMVLEKIVGLPTARELVRTEAPARSYLVSHSNGVLRRKVQPISSVPFFL